MLRLSIPALLLTLVASSQTNPEPNRAPNSQTLAQQIDQIFAKWDSTKSPGCAVSVIVDGKIIYEHGYGMADLDHDIPITPQTVFHVASLSKQFTAAAILLLAQQGKLSLDDDARKYIPQLPDFGARITIRNLLYHTSGVRDQWDLLDLAGWRYSLDLITDNDILQLVSRQKELNFPPGEKELYSNTGYTLLAQIVKQVSGQSLREFTTDHIFRPLDMESTHFRDDHAEIVKHMAYGYQDSGDTYRLSVTNFDTVGATSLLTTVEDLAKWDENFYSPRVGGTALVAEQLKPGTLNSGKQQSYGAGLELTTYRGLKTVEHAGTDAGYRSQLLRFPDQHFSVACLCNVRSAFPVELARKIADVYLAGRFKDAPRTSTIPEVHVPVETLRQYAGLYWNEDEAAVQRIVFRNGKLFADGIELLPLSDNHFQFIVDPTYTFTFTATPADPQRLRLTTEDPGDPPATLDKVQAFRPTAAQLSEYAGSYVSEEIDPVYRIEVQGAGLVLNRPKSAPEKLTPLAEDYFQGLGGILHFPRNQTGAVAGFILDTDSTKHFRFTKQAAR